MFAKSAAAEALVAEILRGSQRIRPVQYIGEQGQRLYEAACGLELEGIVAKRADAPYKAGRSKDWLKIRTPHGRHVQEERSERGNEQRNALLIAALCTEPKSLLKKAAPRSAPLLFHWGCRNRAVEKIQMSCEQLVHILLADL